MRENTVRCVHDGLPARVERERSEALPYLSILEGERQALLMLGIIWFCMNWSSPPSHRQQS